jgi:DNA-binding IclR family transcriptional regulator
MAGSTIKSLERGLQVMNILGSSSTALSLNEIADHFEIDRSSVFRLLGTLLKHGYVVQDPSSKHYSLGYKVLELSGTVSGYSNIETILRPIMRQVCTETRQNTHCAVIDGTDVVFIAVELPKDTVTINISVGTREPVTATALGRALLAYMPPEQQARNVEKAEFPPYTAHSIRTSSELYEILAKVKQDGIAFDNEEYKEGIICFAVPVFDHRGALQYSLGISGHKDTILPNYNEYAHMVRAAGIEASRLLGWKLEKEYT